MSHLVGTVCIEAAWLHPPVVAADERPGNGPPEPPRHLKRTIIAERLGEADAIIRFAEIPS